MILIAHASLLAWMAVRNSPTSEECAQLVAGVAGWHLGTFDLYRVNPPLVRLVASAPVVCCRPEVEWTMAREDWADVRRRPEWSVALDFIRKNSAWSERYFALARLACVPFSVIGGYVCWQWAGELYGERAGYVSLILWSFCPTILAWSATTCSDGPAAALGALAAYSYWKWLGHSDMLGALYAGLTLGLVLLAKFTWIVAFVLWPLFWLLRRWRLGPYYEQPSPALYQLMVIVVLALAVLNLGYAYEGTFTRLGDFVFASRALAGGDSVIDGGQGGNRFGKSWAANIPMPLPRNYIRGVDMQKVDFERGLPSYMLGEWRQTGWWYYYLVGALLKVPLGTWLLGGVAALSTWRGFSHTSRGCGAAERRSAQTRAVGEAMVLFSAAALFAFVSSQSGFSRNFRYVLPAFPFAYIWIGRVGSAIGRKHAWLAIFSICCLTWSTVSSLLIYPHSMSYFNEAAGGPSRGDRWLLASSLDAGQDLYYLRRWAREHPSARPVYWLFNNPFCADFLSFGDDDLAAPSLDGSSTERLPARDSYSTSGWYALSVARLHDPDGRYLHFLDRSPVARLGYSIRVYFVPGDECRRRHE